MVVIFTLDVFFTGLGVADMQSYILVFGSQLA